MRPGVDAVGWASPTVPSFEQITPSAGRAHATRFPSVIVPQSELQSYVNVAAEWNLLVETGVKLGINLDKPRRKDQT